MFEFNATFLISMISFAVFILIMNRIFYKPILDVIEKRQKLINENYQCAKNSHDTAEMLLKQKDERLNDTLEKARKITQDKISQAEKEVQTILVGAKNASKERIEASRAELAKKEEQIRKDTDKNIKSLAGEISKKLLGNDIFEEYFKDYNTDGKV